MYFIQALTYIITNPILSVQPIKQNVRVVVWS